MAPIPMLDAVEFSKIPALNFVVPVVAADPTGYEAGFLYNSTEKAVKFHNGTAWVALGPAGAGGPPTGSASGDLTGSYPGPAIVADAVTNAKLANMAANSFKGNNTGSVADPVDMTVAQAKTLLALTKSDVGLSNVDNTSDAAKPVSSATTTALAGKVDTTTTLTAGNGLTGGGTLAAGRTFDVGAGTGITVAADTVSVDTSTIQARSEKGAANGYAPLDASSLIPTANLPPLAINDVFTVADQASMLALTAQAGDMAIRTDTGKTYVLSASPASTLANWKEIMATGQVVSVNGATGVVSITAASISAVPTTRSVIAGNGLTGGGTLASDATLNVAGGATLSITADSVDVVSAPKWTTGRTIALTGDVTGTSAAFDGSGNLSIATTVVGGSNLAKHFAGDVPAGTTGITITHNLNTRDVTVQVYANSGTYDTVFCDVERTTVNTVTLGFAAAVTNAAYRVVVQGR